MGGRFRTLSGKRVLVETKTISSVTEMYGFGRQAHGNHAQLRGGSACTSVSVVQTWKVDEDIAAMSNG